MVINVNWDDGGRSYKALCKPVFKCIAQRLREDRKVYVDSYGFFVRFRPDSLGICWTDMDDGTTTGWIEGNGDDWKATDNTTDEVRFLREGTLEVCIKEIIERCKHGYQI